MHVLWCCYGVIIKMSPTLLGEDGRIVRRELFQNLVADQALHAKVFLDLEGRLEASLEGNYDLRACIVWVWLRDCVRIYMHSCVCLNICAF